jgi:fructose-1,6-bisphosphatase I
LPPPNRDFPDGKLRLLCEGNPVAFVAENAGGAASNGTKRLLEVQPHDIHQRTPLIVGGEVEMGEFERA